METQSMLVVPKGEDGEIDVYVSTQFPKYIQVTRGPKEGGVAKWFLPAKWTVNSYRQNNILSTNSHTKLDINSRIAF